MRVLLGIAIGVLLTWLYYSKRIREEAERRFATAPESWRQAATTAKTASADQIGRVVRAVDAAPIPQPVRDTLGRATTAARSTAEKLGGAAVATQAAPTEAEETPNDS